ncbi:hypothetical protein [Paenibacillus daejeonensis]|uniref:hypothetical protein n=1 Tax=Paenibacillus daejeonensis TaxID=135193 RepID=UPI000375AF29|nr:hypothetical protein [Paenibacillus daejeonensis]
MSNKSWEPSLIVLTRSLLGLFQGIELMRGTGGYRGQAVLHAQLLRMTRTVIDLHQLSQRIQQQLQLLGIPSALSAGDHRIAFLEQKREIQELMQQWNIRNESEPRITLPQQLRSCLLELAELYQMPPAAQDSSHQAIPTKPEPEPAPAPIPKETAVARPKAKPEPIRPMTAAKRESVLLIPEEIVKIKIGNRMYERTIH